MAPEEAKEARRAYRRKWAKENPDKIRAQQMRHWLKKAREEAAAAEKEATEE